MKLIYEFENYWQRKFIVLLSLFVYCCLYIYFREEDFYIFRRGLFIVYIFSIVYILFFTKINNEELLLDEKGKTKKSKTIKRVLQLIILIMVLIAFYFFIGNMK
jgi:hypothetical protein